MIAFLISRGPIIKCVIFTLIEASAHPAGSSGIIILPDWKCRALKQSLIGIYFLFLDTKCPKSMKKCVQIQLLWVTAVPHPLRLRDSKMLVGGRH